MTAVTSLPAATTNQAMDKQIADKVHQYFSQYDIKAYTKGRIITPAYQEPEGVSLLLEGVVEQYEITSEGNKVIVNNFKPPAFFPMSWAINRTPNTYFFAALTDVKLKQANPDETVAFLRNNPDVMFDLLSRVYKGTDALLKRLVLAASGIASNRLVFELLIEAYRFGNDIDSANKIIKVRHSSLAARSGLARETVSRELHKLEKDGLILLSKEGIKLNVEQLEKKLDFNV